MHLYRHEDTAFLKELLLDRQSCQGPATGAAQKKLWDNMQVGFSCKGGLVDKRLQWYSSMQLQARDMLAAPMSIADVYQ